MDRNRDGRRGNMAAVNGVSRRRPRTSSLRDSPEEDGGMELQETARLRDRGAKKDRDRDRSGRSKRRRGDRMLHGSNREEGEDSSDESMDEDEEEDDEDASAAVRLPPPPPPPHNLSPPSSSIPSNHSHRKSFPTKATKSPAVWKAADEMIGVPVPRKARSASAKRSPECWLSGSGSGAGTGEQIHRQASTSPSRPIPVSGAQAPTSPSSSNASVRKKMKQISGTKHRPPKISKSPSSVQDIEIEVAEVLYGLTRQIQGPSKQEIVKTDLKDVNESSNETKSRVSSPNSISPSPAIPQYPGLPPQNFSTSATAFPAIAPKRKKPRPVKFEDESPSSAPNQPVLPNSSISSTSKAADGEQAKAEIASPKPEKNTASSALAENTGSPVDLGLDQVGGKLVQGESMRTDDGVVPDLKPPVAESDATDQVETKEEADLLAKEPASDELDVNQDESSGVKSDPAGDSPREKFKIDLMVPPPVKSSPETETDPVMDHKSPVQEIEMGTKIESLKIEVERPGRSTSQEEGEARREEKGNKCSVEDFDSKRPVNKERSLDLHLEFGKLDNDGVSSSKHQGLKQPAKVPKTESKPEKAAVQAGSLPLPMPVAGWPGGLSFGYMGQVPSLQAVVPMDATTAPSKAVQLPHFLSQQLRPKRCATHCYIAQNIHYQQIARMNHPFWPAAVGSNSIYGAKPYNLNVMPPSESSILSNPLQGGFPGRCLGSVQDKSVPVYGALAGNSSKEKGSSANAFMDAAQRKPLVLQQAPQVGSTSNMLPAPAFIFPLNQPQAAAAAAAAAAVATSRTALVKSPNMNASSSPNASGSALVSSGSAPPSTATASFNYSNLPPGEAQYLLLQNSGYPFPIPAHVGAPQYRMGNHPQAMPFLNGSFYASQMLHPPQLQQQAQQQPPPTQQVHHNTSTSSGSSSQKYPQQTQKTPDGGAGSTGGSVHGCTASKQLQHLPHQVRQLECDTGSEDSPTVDSRLPQTHRGMYSHNFSVPIHQQNFAFMPTAAALSSGANLNDKQHQQPLPPQQHQHQHQNQQQNMKGEGTPSQAFAMSFASFNGSAASVHHGFDFSSPGQNHAIFQSLPEVARNGCQFTTAAAAAQAAQHKKPQNQPPEDGKSSGESLNAILPDEEERKAILSGKASSSISQHTFSFSRPESDPSVTTILGNNNLIDGPTRTLNLTSSSLNGGRAPNRPGSAAPAVNAATSFSGSATSAQQQQQQHMIHLQKHQQHQQKQQHQAQQLQMQHQQLASRAKPATPSSSVDVYSERSSTAASMNKLPSALAGFPQALIQSSSPTQSPQWKNSARTAPQLSSGSNPTAAHVKSHLPQQQGGTALSAHSNPGHPTQISFGVSTTRSASVQQQQLAAGGTITSSASSATASMGSPPASVSKNAGGSPRTSTGSKTGTPSTSLPLQQMPSSRNSPAGSSGKSSTASNRNVPSLLGQPPMTAVPGSVIKSQQQHQQQQQAPQQPHQLQKQQQSFPPQLFFSNTCLPVQSSQSNAAVATAAGYYPRRPSESQQHHLAQPANSTSVSTGMLSLCPPLSLTGNSSTASEPGKALAAGAAAANMKVLPAPSLLQAAHFAVAAHSASGSPHSIMPPASFPYILSVPSVPVKPSEQKPTAGNDTLHACWQPEKR